MTASNLDEVRKAAENLHAWHGETSVARVRDYALATIPANPTAPITPEWLREVWGFVAEEPADDDSPPELWSPCGRVAIAVYHGPSMNLIRPSLGIRDDLNQWTRYQFACLMTALGLQPKGDV